MLHGLESALGTCGVTVLGRASAAEIAGVVRTASDPASRGEVNRLLARPRGRPGRAGLGRGRARSALRKNPDCYRHDSGISVTWCWREAPRQNVTSDVLARLVAPGAWPKRVSLQYRPFPRRGGDPGAGSRGQRRPVPARSTGAAPGGMRPRGTAHDQARARQAAAEEAAGAGVGLISVYVTVTVAGDAELPRAAAETEAAAESSKIRLRRMTYSQAAGFAATLPVRDLPRRAGPPDAALAPGDPSP